MFIHSPLLRVEQLSWCVESKQANVVQSFPPFSCGRVFGRVPRALLSFVCTAGFNESTQLDLILISSSIFDVA